MKKITKIVIELPNHKELEKIINKDLSRFEITYKVFSDIWEFKSKNIKHSLHYNPKKSSEIISEKDKEFKEAIIINILICLIFGILMYFKRQNDGYIDFVRYMFVLLMTTNWIVTKFKPGFKNQFEKDHNYLVNYFSNSNISP